MRHLATAAPGPPTVSMGGTLDPPLTTTDVTASIFHVPAQNASPKMWSFFPHDFPVPSRSFTSAATTAVRALSKALLHPTPTLFATLGDDQFAAIQTLSRIFSHVTASPPTAPALKAAQLSPAVVFQPDCPEPSPRMPKLAPTALPPRVTIVPSAHIPNNPQPKPVSITSVRTCTRGLTPAPTPAIIEPDRDDPVLQSRYRLQPRPHPYPYNRWQDVTQPRYVAALGHLLHQEEEANDVIDPDSGQALKYWHLIRGPIGDTWIKALAKNLGRLAQGVGTRMPTGTNTVFIVAKSAIPHGRKVTYA